MSATGPVRWAMVGASTIARTYMAEAIATAAGGRLVGIASNDPERAARFAAELEIPLAYESPAAVWADPEVDAVYIGSVNSLHAPQAIAAAEAGKHVLCDKPLASNVEEAEEIARACKRAGVVLGVNHNQRCSPAHLAVRQLLAEGRIGRVLAARVFHATCLTPELRRWRTRDPTGGGAALDVTIHDVDLLRFLLQDEVREVAAIAAAQDPRTAGVEDAIAGTLRFEGGAIATFQDSFSLPFTRTALSVHGDEGWIEVTDAMADDPIAKVTLTDADGRREVSPLASANLYVGVVGAFNAAVHGTGSPVATGEDGLRAVRIVTAARESARRGRSVAIPT